MPNFEKMEIDELKAYRDKIAAKRWELKQEFMAAGKVLNVKLQDKRLVDAYDRLEEKRAKLQEKMGVEPEPQKVGLKKLFK
jgi:hypothetical protein